MNLHGAHTNRPDVMSAAEVSTQPDNEGVKAAHKKRANLNKLLRGDRVKGRGQQRQREGSEILRPTLLPSGAILVLHYWFEFEWILKHQMFSMFLKLFRDRQHKAFTN